MTNKHAETPPREIQKARTMTEEALQKLGFKPIVPKKEVSSV